MARPAGGYRTKDGQRVPGASTIAKLISDPGGLLHWAWTEGVEGRDYRETREKAAGAGTLVHEAAEAWKRGVPYEWIGDPDIVEPAKVGFSAFLEWAGQTKFTVEETEVSLVCEHHAFGGTFDSTWVSGRRCMVDYKSSTSGRLYPESLVQVAAYRHLFADAFPDKPLEGGTYILTFHRETGDFRASWFAELNDAWAAFLACRSLYSLREKLKKRCG